MGLLVLAGCLRVDADLTVEAQTISGTVDLGLLNEWAIEQGSDPLALATALEEDLAAGADSGVTGEVYADTDYTGVRLTLAQVPWDRVTRATDGIVHLSREGDQLRLSVDLAVGDDIDAPVPPWDVRLAVTFPGDVLEHNGQLDDRTVTWVVDQESPDMILLATSAGPQNPWWSQIPVAVWVLVVLVGAGVVLTIIWSRERRAGA